MNIVDIIIKKRDGEVLTSEEINTFVYEYTNGILPDYQMSALLMAIYLKGMNSRETADLTMAMARSGDFADFSDIPGIKVDKHSTGGVADTTTLILAPLVAACGVPIVKMSGRGLGFTGGTIDKLESIPGLNTEISIDRAVEFVKKSGIVIMGQTDNLTPADKMLYALRDVTGTVDNISLIAASIMSKKIASGADAIVLDVKCGSGAFMKDIESAVSLAQEMVSVGVHVGRKVTAIISSMDEPLGMKIGNSYEVEEAIEVLQGKTHGTLKTVSLTLGAHMLVLAGRTSCLEEGRELLEQKITDGSGLAKFREFLEQQEGNPRVIEDLGLLPQAVCRSELKTPRSGYVFSMNAERIGRASLETGAGRTNKTDEIDPAAGIKMKVRIGDYVKEGDVIAEFFSADEQRLVRAKKIFIEGIVLSENKPSISPSILAIITESGIEYTEQ